MLQPVQPKINQRKLLRVAIGLFIAAGLFMAWYFLRDFFQDPDPGTIHSAGWIAAVEETDNGKQAVIIKPDGTIVKSPDYPPNAEDSDIVWQPDGNRVFFSSNREAGATAFHMYRWNPSRNVVQQRSFGSRSQGRPTYAADMVTHGTPTALIESGGIIVEFDPKAGTTKQVLPFVGRNPTQSSEEGNGAGSQFGPEYEGLGSAFREARQCKGNQFIAGVLKRDEGEVLVLQNMSPTKEEEARPIPIVAGQHIDFTVDPHSGNVVVAVQGFQWTRDKDIPQQFIKGDRVTTPYKNAIIVVNPADFKDPSAGLVAVSLDDNTAFLQPSISPDGSTIAYVKGSNTSGFAPNGLFVAPLTPGGQKSEVRLVQGIVHSPNWAPDGSMLTFTMNVPGGKLDVYTVGKDGSNLKNLTNGVANFETPQISPQTDKG